MNRNSHAISARKELPARYAVFAISEDWYVVSHRIELIRQCVQLGITPIVVTNVCDHGSVLEAAGARVVHQRLLRSGRNPLADIPYVYGLWKLYRRVRPVFVHHVALKPTLYGSLAARAARVPAIINELAGRGILGERGGRVFGVLSSPWWCVIGSLLNSRKSTLIVQNESDRCFVQGKMLVDPANVVLIEGVGADPKVFRPQIRQVGVKSPIVVTMVSRMLWSKGVGELISAAKILRQNGVSVEIRLVGRPDPSNPESVPLERLKQWNDAGLICYEGFRDDIDEVWRETDIAVLPSFYSEGVPKALCEAAMSGLPIITTDMPGCNYVVKHGVNGLLVPPRDERALCEAIRDLASSAETRTRMGAASHEMAVKSFSTERMVRRVTAIYLSAIGKGIRPPEDRKRILIAIPSITSYFTFLRELASALEGEGFDVHIATSDRHLNGVECYGALPFGTLHPVYFSRGANLAQHFAASLEFRRLVEELSPDVIHLHFSATVFCGALARRSWWPRTVATIHGGIFPQHTGVGRMVFRSVERWCYARMDRVWVLNRSDEVAYSRLRGLKGRVQAYATIGIGCRIEDFDPARFSDETRIAKIQELGLSGAKCIFVFIGRCVHFKGFAVTVRAFMRVCESRPDARLLIVGEYDRLHPSGLSQDEVDALQAHSAIRKTGWTADVASYLAVADANVFPSVREGMPVNVMESLCMGVPVITLDTRGCSEIVRDGIDGIVLRSDRRWELVSTAERGEAVAAAMITLYDNPDLRRLMSGRAKARRGEFDRMNWVRRQIDEYKQMLEIGRPNIGAPH